MAENISLELFEFPEITTTDATPTAVSASAFYVVSDINAASGPNANRIFSITVRALGQDLTNGVGFAASCYLERKATFKATSLSTIYEGSTLGEDLDDVETDVTYGAGAGGDRILTNEIIRVEDEEMLVTGISPGTNTLTVTRGYNSTTAAAHSNDTTIYYAPNAIQVGSTTSIATHQDASLATTAITFSVIRDSSPTAVLSVMPRVTGVAATTMVWACHVEVQIISVS